MVRSTKFYSEGLGLSVTSRTDKAVLISDTLLLVPKAYEAKMIADSPTATEITKPRSTIISLGVPSLAPVKLKLKSLGVKMLTEIIKGDRRFLFRCIDHDGNIVELFEEL